MRVSICRWATCASACTPASVRPAPYSSKRLHAGHGRDRALDLAGHGPGVLLDLPPAVAGAGVLDGQLEARHRWFSYATGTRRAVCRRRGWRPPGQELARCHDRRSSPCSPSRLRCCSLLPPLHAAPAPPPKLVVVLVVDQMRGDYVDRYGFQWTGGLRRLVDGGAWFRRAAYPYLTTVTCVGPRHDVDRRVPAHARHRRQLVVRPGTGPQRRLHVRTPAATTVSYAAPVSGGDSPCAPPGGDAVRRTARPAARAGPRRDDVDQGADGHHAGRAAAPTRSTWFSAAAGGLRHLVGVRGGAGAVRRRRSRRRNPVSADFGKVWDADPAGRAVPVRRRRAGARSRRPTGRPSFPHALKGKGDAPDAQFFEAWDVEPVLGRLSRAPRDRVDRRAEAGAGQGHGFPRASASRPSTSSATTSGRPATRCRTCWSASTARSAALLDSPRPDGRARATTSSRSPADHGAAPIPEQAAALGHRCRPARCRRSCARRRRRALEAGPRARDRTSCAVQGSRPDPRAGGRREAAPRSAGARRGAAGRQGRSRAWPPRSSPSSSTRTPPPAIAIARAALLSYYPGRSGDIDRRAEALLVLRDGRRIAAAGQRDVPRDRCTATISGCRSILFGHGHQAGRVPACRHAGGHRADAGVPVRRDAGRTPTATS